MFSQTLTFVRTITHHKPRGGHIVTAKLLSSKQETPHIKSFKIDVTNTPFRFFPGQWTDFYVFKDNNTQNFHKDNVLVAGFSMTSSPKHLENTGTIEFTIKKTRHPVTQYMHDAQIGATFHIDGGHGEFYYTKERYQDCDEVVLIAGGIGITPLLSILRHIASEVPPKPTLLICSIRHLSDRFFKDQVDEITKNNPNIRVVWTITNKNEVLNETEELHRGRIDLEMLKKLKVGAKSVCFVCGPPIMVQDVVQHLRVLGVENIQYERWGNEHGTKIPRKLVVKGYDDVDVMNGLQKSTDGIPIEMRFYYGGIERITVKENVVDPRERNMYKSIYRIHPTKNCGSWNIQKAILEEREDLLKKKQL